MFHFLIIFTANASVLVAQNKDYYITGRANLDFLCSVRSLNSCLE